MTTHKEPVGSLDGEAKEENTNDDKTAQMTNENERSSDNNNAPQDDGDVDTKFPEWPRRAQDIKPRIQACNYHQFKNFFSETEMDAAVYVLYGNRSLRNDIKEEKKWLDSLGKKDSSDPRKLVKTSGKETDGGETDLDPIDNKVPHRIRIQSPYIAKQLYKLSDEDLDPIDQHLVFFRPFRILIHFQPQMKEILEELRKKWAATSRVETNGAEKEPKSPGIDVESAELLDSRDAFDHMEAYIKFMESKVMPWERQFSTMEGGRPKITKVAFEDLTYLFREGQYVYRPLPSNKGTVDDAGSTSSSSMSSTYQLLWRVYSIVAPYVFEDPDEAALQDIGKVDQVDTFYPANDNDDYLQADPGEMQIYCYFIDFDGGKYYPSYQYVTIKKYEGERAVTSLPIYPAKYLKDPEDFFAKQEKSGSEFMNYVNQRHVYHFGWTVMHLPNGSSIRESDKHPEFIDSEFIIDFQEAYQTYPFWNPDNSHTPDLNQTLTAFWSTDCCSDVSVKTRRWAENVKGSVKGKWQHECTLLVDGDSVGRLRRSQFLSKDEFLSAHRRGAHIKPEGSNVRLLTRRLVGFSLRERKFVNVSISSIRQIKEQNDAFNMLELHPGHKLMVRSLVREHFRLKERRERGEETFNQDLIKGKGTGLVFLLHGVPGVGKTATAEAIAQEHKKPLFAITCGDLGVDPTMVERNLTRIFRWATVWGCILLLDEADIFFTRRTPSDLQRNALVTVFLRILEYYSGILFLTTNRVGIMDEAFKSRIHMSLFYPPLSLEQTRRIFKTNIVRLEAMEEAETDKTQYITVDRSGILTWAEQHYQKNELGRWNGRQIRNAFQTAASLAHYDALNPKEAEPSVRPGELNWVQFDKVAQATMQFDEYMTKARRATDGEAARKQGIRASENDDTAPSVSADRGFGIPQQGQNIPPSHSQPMQSSREMMYSPPQAHSQYQSPESVYASQEYSRGTPMQTYGRAGPSTPSRVPPQQLHQPDSGISLEFGYQASAQISENAPIRDEGFPQHLATPVKQSYLPPEEHDARIYIQRPSAQPELSAPRYQGYGQPPRQLGNVEQGVWQGTR